jgi:LPXTG-motif cell wall-anchored protein
LAVVAFVLAAAGAPLALTPAAAAEYVTGEWGAYQGERTFWGNMTVGGVYGMCVDPGAEPPGSLSDANARKVCGGVVNGAPDKTAQMAFLLARHLTDTDTQTLVSLSQFARAEYHTGIPVTYPARFDQLVAEASQAGPKDAYVEVDLTGLKVWAGVVAGGQAAKVAGGTLNRVDADFLAGYPATVAITSGNATFSDGTTAKTTTTGTAAVSLAITARHALVADEKVTASIEVAGVPQACFMLHEETAHQRVITPLYTTLANKHTGTARQTPWTPAIATEVTTPTVVKGSAAADRVKADAVSGSWPVLEWADAAQTKPKTYVPFTAAGQVVRANQPTPPSATLPAGATVMPGKQTVTLPGPGSWQAADVALPTSAGAGYYSLRWCINPADQGGNAKYLTGGPYCDGYFTATELFTVPMTLAVTTKVPAARVAKGSPADDTVTVSLPDPADQWITGPDGKPVTVKTRGTLYGSSTPFTEQAEPPAWAVKLGQATVNIALPTSGRDPVTVPAPAGFNLQGSAYWTWVWEIRRADQTPEVAGLLAGDAKDRFGRADESGLTPMSIAIASKLPDQHQAKGEAPDDVITLTLPDGNDQWIALPDGKPATVKATGVYYAASKSSFVISDGPPADAKALGTASVEVVLPTSGRAPVTVAAPAGFAVPSSQYGTWVWKVIRAEQSPAVAAMFDNDAADRFGQALETHVTQMELTIKSEVAAATAPEPASGSTAEVCDSVWVEHTGPDDLWLNQWGTDQPVQVKVDGTLRHSAVPAAQTVIPGNTPVVGDYSLVFTAAGRDHAQRVCHTVSHGDYGAYGFAWRIDLGSQPAATKDFLSKGAATPLWLPVETTMVRRVPVIHTTATMLPATNHGAEEVFLADEIWQTGWPDGPDDTELHGAVGHGGWDGYGPWEADGRTITVELWRIEGEVTPESCAADNPDARLITSNTATPAANTWGGSQKVSGSRFKAEGGDATYTFVVTWAGDARTEPYKSICGERSETISLVHHAPEFATELVTAAEPGSDAKTATGRAEPITIEPGTELVDVLHAWQPDPGARAADMTGWEATWEAFFIPAQPGEDEGRVAWPLPAEPNAAPDPAGPAAVCTPETRFWASEKPVPVTKTGSYRSPMFAAPDQAGAVLVVETVTDASGDQPKVVRRGVCGAPSETALIVAPPAPGITTTAPAQATTGEMIRDEAALTGPFSEGTTVEFWYQLTEFANPDAAPEDLECAAPDPDDMAGAVAIGAVALDHQIPAGDVEKLLSPEFTSERPGCTWIKEIAWQPGGGPDREVLAQGKFGTLAERTVWHGPPESPPASAPPTPGLPRTGPAGALGLAAMAALLVVVGVGVLAARRRNHKQEARP